MKELVARLTLKFSFTTETESLILVEWKLQGERANQL
jgi:hypothetical protein